MFNYCPLRIVLFFENVARSNKYRNVINIHTDQTISSIALRISRLFHLVTD